MRTLKIALMGSLLIAVLACWAIDVVARSGWMVSRLSERSIEMDRLFQQRHDFEPRSHQILDDLEQGRISLRQAVQRLETEATEHYPMFISNLQDNPRRELSMPNGLRPMLAYWLLGHFDPAISFDPARAARFKRLAALAIEYAEIAAERDRQNDPSLAPEAQ